MSDELPIAQVPESTWLRVLAHALDPDTASNDESLVPQDDEEPQSDMTDASADDVDPWDEEPDDTSDTDASLGDETAGVGDQPGGWGTAADVDDLAVVDGEAAVDTYTAALPPQEHDDERDTPDDAGW